MSERDSTAEPRPHPRHLRRPGSGRFLATLAVLAILAIALYLVLAPSARRELTRFNARFVHAPTAALAVLPTEDGRIDALNSQIDALRQRLTTLEQRVASLPVAPAGAPAGAGDALVVALSARVDAIAARQDRQDAAQAATEAALSEAKIWLATTTRRFRLLDAAAALEAGQPLGAIADAPPALTRFAAVAPPTAGGLRTAFPDVARAARAAARPSIARIGLWRAVKARLAELVTIREGDRLVIGNGALATIDRAETAVDADDLAGAIAALARLSGPPADAVADWRGQAQALLDARAALAQMERAG